MKSKRLIKKYDPIKTLYLIKDVQPIQISDNLLCNLIDRFIVKEKVYRDNMIKRFNYNFVIYKIFEEMNQHHLFNYFKLLQDETIMAHHESIYNKLFN